MFKSSQANRFVNMIAIMLIVFSFALGYMGNVIDFDQIKGITQVPNSSDSSTGTGEEVKTNLEDVKGDVEDGVTNAMEATGLATVQEYYVKFQSMMEDIERSIVEFDNYILIVAALLLLFAVKSIISIVPLAATCLISGVVFPFPIALLINLVGVAIILTIKYFWGMHIGEGNFSKLAKKSDAIWELVQDTKSGDGTGNPVVLFMLRIVPSIPIGPVSQMYGKMGYDFWKYLFVSLAGYLLKIVSFTVIGCNVSDPFSSQFIAPLVIILFISGVGMLFMNHVLKTVRKNKNIKLKAK